MNETTRGRLSEYLLALVASTVLLSSFQFNLFSAASNDFFVSHQRDSESLVLGRIIETRTKGILSHQGLLGIYEAENRVDFQYNAYLRNLNPDAVFKVYTSSAGLQGFAYYFLDRTLTLLGVEEGRARLSISKLVTSFLLAASLSLFIVSIKRTLGCLAAASSLALVCLSQWIVVFSNNLYWMFFLIVSPFVFAFYFLSNGSKVERNFRRCCIYVFLAILLKSLAGYEYISTILISTICPLVFFAIRDEWGIRMFTKRFLLLGSAGLFGFIVALVTHTTQLAHKLGGITAGFSVILSNISARTHGDSSARSGLVKESLNSDVFDVLSIYFRGTAFDLNSLLGVDYTIDFFHILIFLLIISALGCLLIYREPQLESQKKINFSAIAALWFSILAPISWYVLAKGHSYIHHHMNHVLWHVPFLLLGFAYIGFIFRLFIKARFKGKVIFLIGAVATTIPTYFLINHPENERNKQLTRSFGHLAIINNGQLQLYHFKNKLIYISENCNESLRAPFFLHAYPVEIDRASPDRRPHGFDNHDFSWKSKQVFTYAEKTVPFWPKKCVAAVAISKYPIDSITTGQFNEEGRLWESRLNFSDDRFSEEFLLPNLTNENWEKGINRMRADIALDNTFANRQSLRVGDYLIFPYSGKRTIKAIDYSDQYVYISVSGGLLEPTQDGFPNTVVLRSEN